MCPHPPQKYHMSNRQSMTQDEFDVNDGMGAIDCYRTRCRSCSSAPAPAADNDDFCHSSLLSQPTTNSMKICILKYSDVTFLLTFSHHSFSSHQCVLASASRRVGHLCPHMCTRIQPPSLSTIPPLPPNSVNQLALLSMARMTKMQRKRQ